MTTPTEPLPTQPRPALTSGDERRDPRGGSAFLPGVHAFRAIATVLVVGQHSAWILPWPAGSPGRAVLADLLDNSTALFVFLSGFLFAHLYGRRSYLGFLRRRAMTVVVPYLFVVTPAALLAVLSPRAAGPFAAPVAADPPIVRFGWFVLHGATMVNIALWFVPMIVLFYVCSPLFGAFLRRPVLFWALPALIAFSVFAHREAIAPDADILGLGAYYVSAYVLGMFVNRHRDLLVRCSRFWWGPATAWLMLLAGQILLTRRHGNYDGTHLFSQEHGPVDLVYLQKLVLCVALLLCTYRFAARLRPLAAIGFAGFGIYLVHCYLVNALKLGLVAAGVPGGLLTWAGTVVVALAGSFLLVRLVQRVLGGWSLYVIGSTRSRGSASVGA